MMNFLPLMEKIGPIAQGLIQACQCFGKAFVFVQNGQGLTDRQGGFCRLGRLCLDSFRLGRHRLCRLLLHRDCCFLPAKNDTLLAIRAGKLIHHSLHFRGMVGGCRVLAFNGAVQHIALLDHKQRSSSLCSKGCGILRCALQHFIEGVFRHCLHGIRIKNKLIPFLPIGMKILVGANLIRLWGEGC